ncbi:hypothetical protein [Lewinella sp. W8]|uniref:hypothetical protein n=1 Tax=Lewinella sp. W8 TaxID=2528208 RepID=UPI001068682C|nr:hypothetical protein [Lewinella sp. W8]MTB53984.1 hypothetical protein [Lewinella sp. W8]
MIALLSKRLQNYSDYFYCARPEEIFLKIIFKVIPSTQPRSFCGPQRYQLHFHSRKLFEKIFPKRFLPEERLPKSRKCYRPVGIPGGLIEHLKSKVGGEIQCLKKDRMAAMSFNRGAQR